MIKITDLREVKPATPWLINHYVNWSCVCEYAPAALPQRAARRRPVPTPLKCSSLADAKLHELVECFVCC